MLIGYEFRQNADPLGDIVVNGETIYGTGSNWQAFDLSWIINKHSTLTFGYTYFGQLANSADTNGVWVQFKWEF